MSRKFPSVPPVGITPAAMRQALEALRGAVTYITAQEQPPLQPLAPNATNAQVIAKVNEVIARLQGSGP